MSEPKSLDEAIKFPDFRTAQYFLTILEALSQSLFGSHGFQDAQRRLSDIGIHQLFGDSFLHGDKVILFCGEDYGAVSPLSTFLDKPYEGTPFAESTVNVYLNDQNPPQVFNNRQDISNGAVAVAPLDTIVFLFNEGEDAGIVKVDKSNVAAELLKSYRTVHDATTRAISFMLRQVNVVGYRPQIRESYDAAYGNVLQHLRTSR